MKGKPRRTWINDLKYWTGMKRYDQKKIEAEKDIFTNQRTAVDATEDVIWLYYAFSNIFNILKQEYILN